jgi:hypothetical protein
MSLVAEKLIIVLRTLTYARLSVTNQLRSSLSTLNSTPHHRHHNRHHNHHYHYHVL